MWVVASVGGILFSQALAAKGAIDLMKTSRLPPTPLACPDRERRKWLPH
jgi:hypothetical protein